MSMSHEEAIQLLSSMFESWERETLMAVFESNGYHVERTIETIIGMEQPELATSTPSQQQSFSRGGGSQTHSQPSPNLVSDSYQEPSPHLSTTSPSQGKRRGAPVQLPDDFLRLPKSPVDQVFLEDEQLAMMLQNELFKEQVDQVLGNEFRDGLRRHQGQGDGRGASSRSSQQRGRQNSATESSGDIMGIPDMGILTGLKGMGEGMKKQLNQLALNFNKSNRSSSSRGERLDEEARPLTASQDYEEEDDDEEVQFNNYSSSNLRSRGSKKDN